MSFNFGTPKTATGFTLPTTSAITSTPSIGGSGDTKLQSKPLTNLFGTPTTSSGFFTTPKTTTVSFGPTTTTSSFTLASSTTAQFNLGSTAATTTTTATSFTPIFGTSTSASVTATPSLKLPTTSLATTSAPTLSLTSTPSLGATTATTQVTTSATIASGSPSLSYAQLEDSINKWTIDLEEQGKFFINQAKQLNAWDNLLVSNSDKILALNETIERVKQQQKQLDQELDFVLAQQNELDELSLPLEKQLNDIPITDQNRFQTYQLSEIIDSQLKQMSEDLKEIVEHLNESNKDEDISDPVIQVSRILNAHMNSLQWIDRQTSQISSHLEQVSHLHESYKKNHMNL